MNILITSLTIIILKKKKKILYYKLFIEIISACLIINQ